MKYSVDTYKLYQSEKFQEELRRIGVSCKAEGPYPKQLPKHELPH